MILTVLFLFLFFILKIYLVKQIQFHEMDAIRAKIKLIQSETQTLKANNEKYKGKIKQITHYMQIPI